MTLDITTELEHQILRAARRKGLDAKGFVLGLLGDYLTADASSSAGRTESELFANLRQVSLRVLMDQMGIEPTIE